MPFFCLYADFADFVICCELRYKFLFYKKIIFDEVLDFWSLKRVIGGGRFRLRPHIYIYIIYIYSTIFWPAILIGGLRNIGRVCAGTAAASGSGSTSRCARNCKNYAAAAPPSTFGSFIDFGLKIMTPSKLWSSKIMICGGPIRVGIRRFLGFLYQNYDLRGAVSLNRAVALMLSEHWLKRCCEGKNAAWIYPWTQ